MKVLYISPQIPYPLTDGGKISIYSSIKSLALLGHNIDFFAYAKNTKKNEAYDELKKICNPYFLDIDTPYTITGAIKNLFSNLPYNVEKYHRYDILPVFDKYFENNKPEIVFLNNIHMAWLYDYIKSKVPDAKIILREENFEAFIMYRFYQNTKNLLLKIYSYIQYKRLLKYETSITEKFDAVIMISQEDEKNIRNYNPRIKTFSIPSAVNTEVEKSIEKIEKKTLAHVGSLSWEPNYQSLIWFIDNVMPLLIKKFTDVKLYIYGNLANRNIKIPNDLKNNIEIVGFVDDIKKHALSKEVLVVPLQIGSGIRIKILEFLAWGAVIVSTDIGKEGIDIKDSEHLLIANTPQEFVDKISLVFENKINKQEITENAKIFIKNNYSFEAVAKLLNYVIKSVK
jgi:glycosyltransferase involved in cell wall biosynthesis